MTDYYKLLGVSADATDDDIKKQYRLLSKKYHPDVGGSQQRMAIVNEAARVLLDPLTRADYDESREVAVEKPIPQPTVVRTAARRMPEPLNGSLWSAILTSVVIVVLAVGWAILRNDLQRPTTGAIQTNAR